MNDVQDYVETCANGREAGLAEELAEREEAYEVYDEMLLSRPTMSEWNVWDVPKSKRNYDALPKHFRHGGGLCPSCHPVPDDEELFVYCTRRDGHTGRHATGDGVKILAVWR